LTPPSRRRTCNEIPDAIFDSNNPMIDSAHIVPPNENTFDARKSVRNVLSHRWLPFVLAAVFLAMDLLGAPYVQFRATFVIPVVLAAWYGSLQAAVTLAILQPVLNVAIPILGHANPPGAPLFTFFANSGLRVVVLLVLAYFINRSARQSRELARRVGLLSPSIPMCFECKKVRDEHSDWTPVDVYVSRHTGANFTNDLCPGCRSVLLNKAEES
jgi:hypothetical protein